MLGVLQTHWTGDLLPVRTVWLDDTPKRKGGFHLKTHRSKILSHTVRD